MSKNNQQMIISDFNLEKLSTKELSKHLEATIDIGSNMIIFGRRGIGKTVICKQVIKNKNINEIYINVSVLERPDLYGFPSLFNKSSDNFVNFLLPYFYKPLIEGDKKCVILLDEVDKAGSELWAPLLELTQFHTINGKTLPNLQSVIMTGNLISEGGARPCLPLLDRAEKYLIEADANSWLEWAGTEGRIHPSITAYIHDHPNDLFGKADLAEDIYSDSSPRGWERASILAYACEKANYDSFLLNKKVCGCVGKDSGLRFQNYYEYYQILLPLIDSIFSGKKNVILEYEKLEISKQLVTTMIVAARFASLLDQSETKPISKSIYDNIGKFLGKASSELALISIRSQIGYNRVFNHNLMEHPSWDVLFSFSKTI